VQEFKMVQQSLPAGVHSVTLPDESSLLLWHVLLVPVCSLILDHPHPHPHQQQQQQHYYVALRVMLNQFVHIGGF
jgi:ubiquitin-protein ligase